MIQSQSHQTGIPIISLHKHTNKLIHKRYHSLNPQEKNIQPNKHQQKIAESIDKQRRRNILIMNRAKMYDRDMFHTSTPSKGFKDYSFDLFHTAKMDNSFETEEPTEKKPPKKKVQFNLQDLYPSKVDVRENFEIDETNSVKNAQLNDISIDKFQTRVCRTANSIRDKSSKFRQKFVQQFENLDKQQNNYQHNFYGKKQLSQPNIEEKQIDYNYIFEIKETEESLNKKPTYENIIPRPNIQSRLKECLDNKQSDKEKIDFLFSIIDKHLIDGKCENFKELVNNQICQNDNVEKSKEKVQNNSNLKTYQQFFYK